VLCAYVWVCVCCICTYRYMNDIQFTLSTLSGHSSKPNISGLKKGPTYPDHKRCQNSCFTIMYGCDRVKSLTTGYMLVFLYDIWFILGQQRFSCSRVTSSSTALHILTAVTSQTKCDDLPSQTWGWGYNTTCVLYNHNINNMLTN